MRFTVVRGILLLAAMTLAGCGIAGIVVTRTHFAPCDGVPQTAPACLAAMDGATSFLTVGSLWLLATAATVVVLALCPLGLLRGRTAQALAWWAFALILVFNVVTEYSLWLAFNGGHWDTPPGTGLIMSSVFLIAAALVVGSATAAGRALAEPAPVADRPEAAPVAAAGGPPLSRPRA